ncbi:unnamed protein product [Clonostachys solani]|uniref:Uncharacterized protein n=1 Tax=Clonostachys solani TaxID=160281 RepID=A0A9N9YWA4_9HYPO|nr:unnamed protein product [Clonostachys solani]
MTQDTSDLLKNEGFTAADVCIGARCKGYQHYEGMVIAPFLCRGSIGAQAVSGTPKKDSAPINGYLVGMNNLGQPVIAEVPNALKQDMEVGQLLGSPCFRKTILCKSIDGKPLREWVPFNSLFDASCLADVKVASWNTKQKPSQENREGRERAVENRVFQSLSQNGLPFSSESNQKHVLDPILVFQGHNDHKSRRTRLVNLESYKCVDKLANQTAYEFFTLPAFGLTMVDIGEDI